MFTLGLLLILASIADFKTGKMETHILVGIMLAIIAQSLVVILYDLSGCILIQVRIRNKIPAMRRKVNTNYLENRADNRYGLIPFVGPIMSGLCAFLNQPPLVREGRLLNWDAYVANLITYGAFVGAVLCYESGLETWTLALLAVTGVLALYDVVQDVREALNFSFGACFFDNCRRAERGGSVTPVSRESRVMAATETVSL